MRLSSLSSDPSSDGGPATAASSHQVAGGVTMELLFFFCVNV